MKKEARQIFNILASEVSWSMCSFCKYSEACGCEGMVCIHPLGDRMGHPNFFGGLYPGDDCWTFRPNYDVGTIADIVGIVLSNGWRMVAWTKNRKGQLEVVGE